MLSGVMGDQKCVIFLLVLSSSSSIVESITVGVDRVSDGGGDESQFAKGGGTGCVRGEG